jgi:hypothetical protein
MSFIIFTLPCFIRVIKTKRMGWVGHTAYIGEMRHAYKILVGKVEGMTWEM